MRSRLKKLAGRYNRYGYLMLHGLLRNEGLVQNKKRTYRLYTEMGLQGRIKNWPRGFLTDEIDEARRFLRAAYQSSSPDQPRHPKE